MIDTLERFQKSLSLAKSLYEIDKSNYSNPPLKEQVNFVQGLRGGAAVMCVAAFENFLKELFEFELSRLSQNPPPKPFNELPEKMRISSIYFSLEDAMKGPRHEPTKPKIDRLPEIISAARTTGYIINPKSFANTGSNPSSDTIKQMFKNIGFNDIFGNIKPDFEIKWGAAISNTFIVDKLNEIVNRRHVVAHTAVALDISRSDLLETFKFLDTISQLLHEKLVNFINDLLA